jgi:hypothetical protein
VDISYKVKNKMGFRQPVNAASGKCQADRKTISAVNVKRYFGTAILLADYMVL